MDSKDSFRTISNDELKKLESFIGYGNPGAEVIFFGLEEAGGGWENLQARLNADTYEFVDCRDFHINHLKIFKFHRNKDNQSVEVGPIDFQSVWRYMSYLMLRLEGKSRDELLQGRREDMREYQRNHLGSEKGNTLLTEIYPIPCQNVSTWGTVNPEFDYQKMQVITQYTGKKDYKEKVIENRVKLLKEKVFTSDDFKAKAIICYGKSAWDEYKEFFKLAQSDKAVQFNSLEGTDDKCAVGLLKINGSSKGTKVILAPFFGNGRISYDIVDKMVNEIKRN